MSRPGVKYSGVKLLPQSDLRVGSTSGGVIRKIDTKNFLFRLGTWNVRTLNQAGKLENLKMEMDKCNVSVIGLSEVRWPGQGEKVSDNYTMFYSGGERAERGVAILMKNEIVKSVLSVQCCSDRLMFVKLSAEPVDILIVQVYMPTSASSDEEVERMYDAIEDIIQEHGKGKIHTVIMGDWNSVVGNGKVGKIVGPYGLGNQNDRGKMLIEFCQRNKFVVTNTWFKRHKRRLYTWKKPGDGQRYQIDYILVKQRFRNSVKSAGTLNGADINSDHNLVVADISTRMKIIRRKTNIKVKWNLEKFRGNTDEITSVMENKFKNLLLNNNLKEAWNEVKKVLINTLENKVGRMERPIKKPWITNEMVRKMEERRTWKNKNEIKYKALNNALRRETDEAKKKYIESVCDEIMELQRRGRYDLMYQKARSLEWKNSNGSTRFGIENNDGTVVSEQKEILKVWEDYIATLYDKENRPQEIMIEEEKDVNEDDKGPSILRSEVEKAIKDLGRGKATGDDNIPAEILKVLGNEGIKKLTELINNIYKTGIWPNDFLDVTMIALKKKPDARKCADHRTISLISHVGKVIARIINRRLENKIEAILGEDQFGFRKGKGTRDAIGMIRAITERVQDTKEKICVAFIDWQKAFDRVNWKKLLTILKEIGVDWRDRRLILNLYLGQQVKVRVGGSETQSVVLGRGVRQGCCLSPSLFNLYNECLIEEAVGNMGSFKIGGRKISTIKYADDLALITKTEEELQEMMTSLVETGRRYGMEINVNKSKVMMIASNVEPLNIVIGNTRLEQVDYFKYLGSTITNNGECTNDIRTRIALAKAAFNSRRSLLTGKLDLNLKKKLVKCYVWSVALYGAETWTLRKKERNYLEAFEMWCWRRMEKISYMDRITNEEVLRRVQENRSLISNVLKRKANWIGHILRRNGLLHDILEGKMEGGNASRLGRRRIQILDDLKNGKRYWELKEEVENREGWRTRFRVHT